MGAYLGGTLRLPFGRRVGDGRGIRHIRAGGGLGVAMVLVVRMLLHRGGGRVRIVARRAIGVHSGRLRGVLGGRWWYVKTRGPSRVVWGRVGECMRCGREAVGSIPSRVWAAHVR